MVYFARHKEAFEFGRQICLPVGYVEIAKAQHQYHVKDLHAKQSPTALQLAERLASTVRNELPANALGLCG